MHWIKRFLADAFGAQLDGFRVAAALPLVFVAMAGCELAQHAVEMRIGFFASEASAKAVSLDGARMAFGWLKMLLVYVAGFYAIRYLVWRDAARAVRDVRGAALRYAPYLLYSLAVFALIVFAVRFVPAERVATFRMVVALTQLAIEPLLMLWVVSAATDGKVGGPIASARALGLYYLYALPLLVVARIPSGAAHTVLNRFAIGKPVPVAWAMLAVDALLVGLLVAVIPAIAVRVASVVGAKRPPAPPERIDLALA